MYTTDKKQLEGTWQSASQYIHVVCQFYPGSLEHMMQGGVNTHSLHHAALFLTSLQSPMQQILYVHLKEERNPERNKREEPPCSKYDVMLPEGKDIYCTAGHKKGPYCTQPDLYMPCTRFLFIYFSSFFHFYKLDIP